MQKPLHQWVLHFLFGADGEEARGRVDGRLAVDVDEYSEVVEAVLGGEHNLAALEQHAMQALAARGWQPDYLTVRRRVDLQVPQGHEFQPGELVALGAARLGNTRLIDNLEF